MNDGDPHGDAIWHDRAAEVRVVLEVSRACPRPMLPTGGRPGRASAAPAAGPALGTGAVGAALEPLGYARHATRQRLRAWTLPGAERVAPCAPTLEVEGCFVALLRWVLAWWSGETLPLAIDATSLGGRWVVLSLSVLYR